jgi:putative transposase
MLVLEYKLVASKQQAKAIEEAIRTAQFIRNKCLRLWLDTNATKNKLYIQCAVLAKEYPFAKALNSQARQASSERTAYAISRYLKPDQSGKRLRKPQFQKDNRSVEYKTTGWKLSANRTRITFTDGIGIGKMKMLGTQDLCAYDLKLIKRVRIVRKADMFFVQFCVDVDRSEPTELTGRMVGLDMGLSSFYTDSNGQKVDCPKFLRKAEKQLKREQRRLSRKKKGSKNRVKARVKVARRHLRVKNQRKDFAVKLARCVVASNDVVVLEDLQVRNLVRNRHLAKSIHDVAWSQFGNYLLYYGKVFGKPVVKVPPAYTSQDCSSCGNRVKKSLSERTHICSCGCILDRDENAARNILRLGLAKLENYCTAGHVETGEGLPSETLAESVPLLPAHAG